MSSIPPVLPVSSHKGGEMHRYAIPWPLQPTDLKAPGFVDPHQVVGEQFSAAEEVMAAEPLEIPRGVDFCR